LNVSHNYSFTSFVGLSNLENIGNNFIVSYNYSLINFNGLDHLETINRKFKIVYNNSLINLEGLTSLDSIGWDLEIGGNDLFESTLGLSSLRYIWGRLFIYDNTSVHSITGFYNLEYIYQVYCLRNSFLETIGAFPNLEVIKNLQFIDCPLINDIENLSLNDSLNSLTIMGCANVIDFSISNSIEHMYELNLVDVLSLENMDEFSNLKSIEHSLSLSSNPNLGNINGLNQLDSIGYLLIISDNDQLTSLSPLIHVASKIDIIHISDNGQLPSLTGLDNIELSNTTILWIYDNPVLNFCSIDNICNYLSESNNYLDPHGNSNGCNSDEEILENCTVSIEGFNNYDISISPNPAHSFITVNSDIDLLQIKNNFGQIVKEFSGHQSKYQINDLEEGIYFVIIESSDGRSVLKLIVSK